MTEHQNELPENETPKEGAHGGTMGSPGLI